MAVNKPLKRSGFLTLLEMTFIDIGKDRHGSYFSKINSIAGREVFPFIMISKVPPSSKCNSPDIWCEASFQYFI